MKKQELIDKVDKFLNKGIFIIEFFISLPFVIEILNIITLKEYEGFYSIKDIIIAGLFAIALFEIIFHICKTQKDKVEKLFVTFAIPLSIAFAILILPLNVPDEGTHVLRAYDMSLGHIMAHIDENGYSSSIIPNYLLNSAHTRVDNYKDLKEEITESMDYKEEATDVCAAQNYSPFLYIGSSLGMLIARILNINIFYGIYIARLFNIIIFLVFGYFSIKKIPIGKVVLAVFLCMPMMLQQAASCSADAVLNAVIVFYISNIIYILLKKDSLTRKDRITIYVLTAFTAMFKFVYIVLAGLLFIGVLKKEKRKEFIKLNVVTVLVGSIFLVGWLLISSKYTSSPVEFSDYLIEEHVNASEQVEYIKNNPIDFAKTIIREYKDFGQTYLEEAVGSSLGWYEIEINPLVIFLFLAIMIISAISEENNEQLSKFEKIWTIIIFTGILLLISVGMYIIWTSVGVERVARTTRKILHTISNISILMFN